MITEKEYSKIVDSEHRKKFAQFFTPEQIAMFMSKWILDGLDGNVNILEPAFGLGIFSRTLCQINPNCNITGYDIDETIFNCKNILYRKEISRNYCDKQALLFHALLEKERH